MVREYLKSRMRDLGIRILRMSDELPSKYSAQALAHQIIRSGTSVGANYSAACRCKSRRDFINKMKIVEEELDETIYWLEMIVDSGFIKPEKIKSLLSESNELISIVVRSLQTARNNQKK
jgi:four helix bundle protein